MKECKQFPDKGCAHDPDQFANKRGDGRSTAHQHVHPRFDQGSATPDSSRPLMRGDDGYAPVVRTKSVKGGGHTAKKAS